jgi:HAD superfamily hydrolase (TIGR01509 family)
VLLFDLGGVLVHTRGFAALKSMLAMTASGEALDDQAIRDRWLGSPSVRDFELGRISPPEFAARFLAGWQVPLAPSAFLEDLTSWIKRPYPGAEKLLAVLREKHHVSCLTNCDELHWVKMTPILRCLDSTFSSHLLGEIKPDERAFRVVVNELQVEPAAVRFFGDSRANVESARRLGIRGFLVQGLVDVRRVLREEGLL